MRKTSQTDGRFPFGDRTNVCYIEQSSVDGTIKQVGNKKADQQDALDRAHKGEITLYAVWPGQWRSDLFLVDDLFPMADALGVVLVVPCPAQCNDGVQPDAGPSPDGHHQLAGLPAS